MYDEKKELIANFKIRFPDVNPDDVEITCIKRISYKIEAFDVREHYTRETLALLHADYNGPEFNIFTIFDNGFIRFYVYLVSKEKVIMAALPTHLAKLIKSPVQVMKDRCEDSLHLFQDAIKELAQEGSELQKNNNVSRLLNANFLSHIGVPRGYYDSKHNGILYVIDAITGERIRKDESILTTSGFFTSSDRGIREIAGSYREAMLKLLRGDQNFATVFKDKFIYESGSGTFIPFDPAMFRIKLSARRVTQVVLELYTAWTQTMNMPALPVDVEGAAAAFPAFKDHMIQKHLTHTTVTSNQYVGLYFPDSKRTKESSLLVPDTSPFFPGMVIEDGDYIGEETERVMAEGLKPLIALNNNTGVVFNRTTIGQGRVVLPVDTGTFPFNFFIQVMHTAVLTTNKSTNNIFGEVLDHRANVKDYKVSFLMTPWEQKVYDGWDAEHRAELKAYNAKVKEEGKVKAALLPKPVKPSSKEPIYLGLELEVIMKAPNQNAAGKSQFVQDIAKSVVGNHMIAKHDGTLGAHGVELVTIPATLAFHKKFLDDHFFSAPDMFHKRVMVTDTCGIHVHISKNAMTALDLGKFMSFIYSAKNADFINAYAGRTENHYCHREKLVPRNIKGVDISAKVVTKACQFSAGASGVRNLGLATRKIEGDHHELHHAAINIQNAHTIELRIFKGSTDRNRIFRIMEFCESLVKFVRCHSTQQMTVYDYVQFILESEKKKFKGDIGAYHNVTRWLASKNYIGHTTKHGKDPKTGLIRNKLIHVYGENKVPFPDTLFHKNKENYREYYSQLELGKKEA